MADYTVTWAEIAFEQYWALRDDGQQQVNERWVDLRRRPGQRPASYDQGTDHWTVEYGDGAGLLVYAVVPQRRRVIILRLIDLT